MHLLCSCLFVLLPAGLLQAAEKYTLQFKSYPDAGMSVTITDVEKGSGSTKFLGPDGKLLHEEKAKSSERVYTLTILQRTKSDAPPQKYLRAYEKASEARGGKTGAFSYQGRTVLFERKGKEVHVGVFGKKPLDAADLDKLIEKANDGSPSRLDKDRALIPDRAVAVGDRWKVDPRKLGAMSHGADLGLEASRAEARLVKVYRKGKGLFGVIEIAVKLAVKGVPPEITFDPPANLEATITLDLAIDGSSTARTETIKGKVKGKGTLQQGKEKVALEVDEELSGSKVCSSEKKAGALEAAVVKLVGPGGDWTEFTSKEGRFSATFPGKPTVVTKKEKTRQTTSCQVVRDRGNITYGAYFTDYARIDPNIDPKSVLAALVKQFAANTKKKKEIKLNGFDGIELVQETGEGPARVDLVYRAYFVNGRLYQVMVASGKAAKEKVQAARFLDSFKLQEKKEKKPNKDDAR